MLSKLLLLSSLFIVAVSPAYAHDPKSHTQRYTEGQVTKAEGKSFEMSTADGSVQVSVARDTKFEFGAKGKPGTISDLKVQDHVRVAGTRLESGELVASEVLVGSGQSHDDSHSTADDH